MEPIDKKALKVGQQYLMAFTRPLYDRITKRFQPDNFRYVNPQIVTVIYGETSIRNNPYFCWICRKKTSVTHNFFRRDVLEEVYLSPHCFAHGSTTFWPEGTSAEEIRDWYAREDLKLQNDAGDPLAAFVEEGDW